MAPIPSAEEPRRLVVYYQTTHTKGGQPISLLDLARPYMGVTHVIIGCLHIHADDPRRIHLNDHPPTHARYETMWKEMKLLQSLGIKVLCMLGGAAPGSFSRETLDAPSMLSFRTYYEPLRDMMRYFGFDGIDVDVEQEMSQPGINRFIDTLRADFGTDWLVTMAPVATALMAMRHLSGFDYFDLEEQRGASISWYNTQFYNNWGNLDVLDTILTLGWDPRKVVVGLLTSTENGTTSPPSFAEVARAVTVAREKYGAIGGIMGWEYFNSVPGGTSEPWRWAREMASILGITGASAAAQEAGKCADGPDEAVAEVPGAFEYDSDSISPT